MLLSVLLLGSICFPSSAMTAAAELLFRYQDRIPTRQEGIISTRSKLHFNQSHRVQCPGLLSPCFAHRRMFSAMFCTRVGLTGCGSVATAPSSAWSVALIRPGENEAFEKSFIRCVQFPIVRDSCKDNLLASHTFPTSFSAWGKSCPATIMPPSTGGASDAARQAKAHPQRSL